MAPATENNSLLAGRDVEHEKRFGEVMFRIQTGVRSSQS
jgi:hypothetical protein